MACELAKIWSIRVCGSQYLSAHKGGRDFTTPRNAISHFGLAIPSTASLRSLPKALSGYDQALERLPVRRTSEFCRR